MNKRSFSKLNKSHIEFFKSFLPASHVIQDSDRLLAYNTDWTRKFKGNSQLVLKPVNTEQVHKIVSFCHQERLPITPQGGNTGLVGGGVPVYDEIILSMSAMNKILAFDRESGVVTCEAGCILETLENEVETHGYTMPLDLGAKGSCQIGGNVATNAGGLRLLRYGSLHGNVMGLEVVTPRLGILENMNTLRKDNTGYDIKQLFIGSEGTLGIVTKVSILAPKKSLSKNVMILGLENFDRVKETFDLCKQCNGEILSAFEFWDLESMNLALSQMDYLRNPFSEIYPFYVLIETSGSNKDHDSDKLATFLESVMDKQIAKDGVFAQDASQAQAFWLIRESIPEACTKLGPVYKYDISLPMRSIYTIVEKMRSEPSVSGKNGKVVGFGHLGDGNLHLNIMLPETSYDAAFAKTIDPIIYDYTGGEGGSISAEHGIGQLKRPFLIKSKNPQMIESMKSIKDLFDPHGIMNPYKVI